MATVTQHLDADTSGQQFLDEPDQQTTDEHQRNDVESMSAPFDAEDPSELSYGSVGDCYDNAAMEAFWASLKREIVWLRDSIYFATRRQARSYLFEFIEVFHNRQCHQTGLADRKPAEVRKDFLAVTA